MSDFIVHYDLVLLSAERMLAQDPNISGAGLFAHLQAGRDLFAKDRQEAPGCSRCGLPVTVELGRCLHLMPDRLHTTYPGCRAASWDWRDDEDGHDESLHPRWRATMPKGYYS